MTLVVKADFHNFWLFIPYIFIRYKVYVRELKRKLFEEFDIQDLHASHYLLLYDNKPIGAARSWQEGDTAIIGRIGIIKEYRNQGHGKEFINKLLSLVQKAYKINSITIITLEPSFIKFYSRFGFKKDGIVYFDQSPYMRMRKQLN